MEKPSNPLYKLFISHPELNASSIARWMGMSQSLFAQYVNGTKKPSKERLDAIFETVRSVGRELAAIWKTSCMPSKNLIATFPGKCVRCSVSTGKATQLFPYLFAYNYGEAIETLLPTNQKQRKRNKSRYRPENNEPHQPPAKAQATPTATLTTT